MKKIGMMILSMLLISSLILFISGCAEDILEPDPLKLDVPTVKAISASTSTVMIGESVEVSVQADDASTYAWSADMGSFDNPSAATTMYTAPIIDTGAVARLKCTVTNSNGSRYATVSVKIVTSLLPDGVAAYWSFDSGLTEEVSGFEPEITGDVSISSESYSGDGAAQFGGTFEDISFIAFPDLALEMGPESEFTVTFWAKTENEEGGYLFGKALEDGLYLEGGKAINHWGNEIYVDVWGYFGAGEETDFATGDWYHVAWVKTADEMMIFKNGEEIVYTELEEWSEDGEAIITIGGAAEEPGIDWPGNFNGLLDDIRFYPYELSEEEIANIYDGG